MKGGDLPADDHVIEMFIDRSGLAPAVFEKSAGSGETHAIHHVLRCPNMAEVMDAEP